MSSRIRRPSSEVEPSPRVRLRRKLRDLLALSLATPVATFAACRGAGDGAPNLADASLGPGDASADAMSPEGGAGSEGSDAGDANACAPIPVEAGFFGQDGSCDKFVYLPCGVPPELQGVRCNPSVDLCTAVCPAGFFFVCDYPPPTCVDSGVVPGAPVYLDCTSCIGTNAGRRPVGLLPPRRHKSNERRRANGERSLGAYFAQMAYAEAASVEAFVQLAARLASLRAPARLQRGAMRAAEDEKRHARTAARLALRYGDRVAPMRPCPFARLTFEDFARENAVEGCVRETFAALIGMHQAERAQDPRVGVAMRTIAKDEARHAELAWAIHRWAMPRLSEGGRRRVRQSQARALAELKAGAGGWAPEVGHVAGLPCAAVEARLVGAFGRSLFGIGAGAEGRCA